MTNQDPIAEHEAKIAAWRGNATSQTLDNWHDGPHPIAYVLDPCEIVEAVALMRSAPDGDAKLRELRDWVVKTARVNEESQGYDSGKVSPLGVIRKIDRLLSKPSEPAPTAEIDRLVLAENKRLANDREMWATRSKALEAERDRAIAENARLQADLAAARADQAAMARDVLQAEIDGCERAAKQWQMNADSEEDQRAKGRLESRADQLRGVAYHMKERLAALPAQQPNVTVRVLRGPVSEAVVFDDAQQPEPDAATRDGDEVLRELAQWAGGEDGYELWRAVAELCRRELARGK